MKNNKTVRLGIVGYGFVGKATDSGFDTFVEKYIVDPKLETSIEDLARFKPEIVFICVPTPMANDGTQNYKIIKNVVRELVNKCPNSINVVKSTVLPSVLDELEKLDKNIIYNPEFLREKHANDDFINSEMLIFGGNRNIADRISKVYLMHSKCITSNHYFTDLKSASLIKYSINTFLASKVIFFNEIHNLFEKMNVSDNWEVLTKIISIDKRIGKSHMNVPGHDGRKGFGGACFPKDSLAFIKYAEKLGTQLNSLKTTVKVNNSIRSQYTELDPREKEQNVSFNKKL